MPTKLYVTLSEVSEVASRPLKESTLWALLQISTKAVLTAVEGSGPGPLITPESLLLYPGGRVEVLAGVHDEADSQFRAPEARLVCGLGTEKIYVYALGASLWAAFESGGLAEASTSPLRQLLTTMIAREPAVRPPLQAVVSLCEEHTTQGARAEVDSLVTLVLGTAYEASSGDEEDICDLDKELQAAMDLQLSASSQSVRSAGFTKLSTSSLPLTYCSSLANICEAELQRPLSLSLQFQDIGLLASKSQVQSRRMPQEPDTSQVVRNNQRTASLSGYNTIERSSYSSEQQLPMNSPPPSPPCSPPPSSPSSQHQSSQFSSLDSQPPSPLPSLPPSPPSSLLPEGVIIEKTTLGLEGRSVDRQQDIVWPESGSSLVTAFSNDTLLAEMPPLPPRPPLPAHPSYIVHQTPDTATALQKIDSLLQPGTELSAVEDRTSDLNDHSCTERENSPLGQPSSGEEFEFSLPTLPVAIEKSELDVDNKLETHRALDEALQHLDANDWEQTKVKSEEEDEVRALYATVDKSKKTKHCERTDLSSDLSELKERIAEERPPLPLPPADDNEYRFSGVYEDVEVRCVPTTTTVDSNGYTEVGGGTRPLSYEVGYSGCGSLQKLFTVLGPEFKTMSGEKVSVDRGTLPEGRCTVEVVLLNGRTIDFVVGFSATTSLLFEQVVSYQTLMETHVFGLAVRKERDDIFLDPECKLVKHAPSGWANATNNIPFTVFFRVKFYVEDVNQLLQPLSRHLQYLQLRKDILEGKMFCHEDHALQLAALAILAEKGSTANHITHYRLEDYLPTRIVEKLGRQYIGNLLSSMFKDRFGLSQTEAELEFIKQAQKLPEYGMLFYRVAKTKNGEIGSIWLGFCVRGLVVFDVHRDVKTATHHCAWHKTTNISCANRKFVIELQDNPKPLVFFASSYKRARYLLELSMACHKFHLIWSRKVRGMSQDLIAPSSDTEPERLSPVADVVVEYPSLSRPSSVAEDITPSSVMSPQHPSTGSLEAVQVTLRRGEDISFGFSVAGSTHSTGVYVARVITGSASDGRLLTGDEITAVNGEAVGSYQQIQALMKTCGSQVTVDVRRIATPITSDAQLPTGERVCVHLSKEGGVLGILIAGGSDKPYGRGFVRIKQLTANTASSRSGVLKEGDIILQVNTVSLRGLTHCQAADTILNTGDNVCLQLHRPCDPHWWQVNSEQSLVESDSLLQPPPRQSSCDDHQQFPEEVSFLESFHSSSEPHLSALIVDKVSEAHSEPNLMGESSEDVFNVTLRKGYHGFGFRLDRNKSEREGCGVFILAIDDNPAKASRMLQPGDEIICVDGKSLINHTHQECLHTLRTACGESTLTIRRHLSL